MSTSPLSDTFPGNLAGAARLWRPEQGGSKVVTATGWGDGLTWDKALHQLPLLQPGKVPLELAWGFQWDFFSCGHRDPRVTLGFLHRPTQNVPSSSFRCPRRQCVGFPSEAIGKGCLHGESTVL